eukprot:3417932-Pleurochrysis_carterae.AAC.1
MHVPCPAARLHPVANVGRRRQPVDAPPVPAGDLAPVRGGAPLLAPRRLAAEQLDGQREVQVRRDDRLRELRYFPFHLR